MNFYRYIVIVLLLSFSLFCFSEEKTIKTLGKIEIVDGEDEEEVVVKPADNLIRQELTKLIPASGDIKGWKIKTPTRFFNSTNLWEYINGAAEHYIKYGFRQIAATEFQKEDNQDITLTLDIYDMENLYQGFGSYSMEKPPDGKFEKIGTQGFSDELSTVFFKDKYLVKIFIFDMSPDMSAAMRSFAEYVAAKIPGEPKFPDELMLFPTEKKIPDSEQFIMEGILGESALRKGFITKYKFAENTPDSSIFYIKGENQKEIKETYNKIKAAHEKRGNPMREVNEIGDNCLDVLTKYNGRIIIITKGEKIAGGWFLPEDDLVSLQKIAKMLK